MVQTALGVGQTIAAGHPLIDIDLTVFVQFGLFLILFYFSNKLLFQPYLNLATQNNVTGYRYLFHRQLDYRHFAKI